MATLISIADKLLGSSVLMDDTITDRLNHHVTSSILIIFAVFVSTKQYVGSPIECWTPHEFSGNQAEYANNFCWIQGTYFVPWEEENIPSIKGGGRRSTVSYYQWIPFILLVQAFFYLTPNLVWRNFQGKSGLDVENFIENGRRISSLQMKNDIRGPLLDHMTIQLERYLKYNTQNFEISEQRFTISLKHLFTKTCFMSCSTLKSNYFITLQFCVKSLYLSNTVAQFYLLGRVLNEDFYYLGINYVSAFFKKTISTEGGEDFFPKVTMCDFMIRRLGNKHNYSIQCALVVNLFNEKVFLFIWFWTIFLIIANLFSLLMWTLRNFIRSNKQNYIKRLLYLAGFLPRKIKINEMDHNQRKCIYYVEEFVNTYLRQDGVFLIQLLNQATNTITTMETVGKLWTNFIVRNAAYNVIEPEGRKFLEMHRNSFDINN